MPCRTRTSSAPLPHEKGCENLELLGPKVIPELEKRGRRVDDQAMFGQDCAMDMISGLRYAAAQKKAEEEAAAAKAKAEAAEDDAATPAKDAPEADD